MSSDHRNKTLSPRSHTSLPPAIKTSKQSQFTLTINTSPSDKSNGGQSASTQFHSITPQSFQQALGLGDPSNLAFHTRPRQRRPGFSCDTCRKRRVRCDRSHPVCNRCRGKRTCTYPSTNRTRKKSSQPSSSEDSPTHENRIVYTNSPRRPVKPSTRAVHRRSASPTPLSPSVLAYPSPNTPESTTLTPKSSMSPNVPSAFFKRQRRISFSSEEDMKTLITNTETQIQLYQDSHEDLLVQLLQATGWEIYPIGNGVVRFETNIGNTEQLRTLLTRTLDILHDKGNGMSMPVSDPFGLHSSATRRTQLQRRLPQGIYHLSLFERLSMITRPGAWHPDMSSTPPLQQLSTDKHIMVITPKHIPHYIKHWCGCGLPFPLILSPIKDFNNASQSRIKRDRLISILSYMIPHFCFWHSWSPLGQSVHYHRECGKTYQKNAEILFDDPGDINQLFHLLMSVSRDYDRGNMQSAYLTMGVSISLCFNLNLHKRHGYDRYTDPHEKEFAKRIFWSLWWFDTTVPQLYSSPAVIDPEDVTAEYPDILADYDHDERLQVKYMQLVIQSRRLNRILAKRMKDRSAEFDEEDELDFLFEQDQELRSYYHTHHSTLAIQKLQNTVIMQDMWRRRTLCLSMADYCMNWLSLYQRHLPSATHTEPLSELHNLALRVCSEAADILTALFDAWFSACGLNFDCVFRPCLFHFLGSITIHKYLIVCPWVSHDRVSKSIQSVKLMLRLYMKTPMQNLFPKSHIYIDINAFFKKLNIEDYDDDQLYWIPIYDSLWHNADNDFHILNKPYGVDS
ncbi:hypothetical protein INT44_001140 [Umbelopsis vinacea]|uniref:Zn(2)-C6 fungal-type domain-containing protein n=1 Tax=Umbelopsis vinacea TaxID=44442 RepID=A0A8H7Q9B4_9FUNG|nr:hypothetical protein INT44_001140 [Umbelopsis vinacea]